MVAVVAEVVAAVVVVMMMGMGIGTASPGPLFTGTAIGKEKHLVWVAIMTGHSRLLIL